MSTFILKSNSALLATSASPAYTTSNQPIRFVPLVQGSNVSVSIDRQTSKQVGSPKYAIDSVVRAPDVSFDVDYSFSPQLASEYLFGLALPATGSGKSLTSGMSSRDQNFYLLLTDKNGDDILKEYSGSSPRLSYSGTRSVAIGNCFLKNYSVSFQVGQMPAASASFVGSNLIIQNLTSNLNMLNPAINLLGGNYPGTSRVSMIVARNSLTGYAIDFPTNQPSIYRLPAASPQNVSVQLENLEMGGTNLVSGAVVQSFNLSVPFERTDLYGLGSNHVYGRKLQLPARASIDVSAVVHTFSTGNLHLLNNSEKQYNFDITFTDPKKTASGQFMIRGAKINSFSYSLPVNNQLEFTANYSVEATDASGFFMRRL